MTKWLMEPTGKSCPGESAGYSRQRFQSVKTSCSRGERTKSTRRSTRSINSASTRSCMENAESERPRLANVLSSRLVSRAGEQAIAPRVNCDATDDFSSLWKKVLAKTSR